MDELENPDVTGPGQSVPVLPGHQTATASSQESIQPGIDTAEQLGLSDSVAPISHHLPTEPLARGQRTFRNEPAPNLGGSEGAGSEQSAPAYSQAQRPVPVRPGLKRESSASTPQHAPPAAPNQSAETNEYSQEPPDSLTLADLRRIRSTFPPAAPKQQLAPLQKVYDFEYRDTQSFAIELEEWFTYSDAERARLLAIEDVFQSAWSASDNAYYGSTADWTQSPKHSVSFVDQNLELVRDCAGVQRSEAIQVLCHLALGVWNETAGLQDDAPFSTIMSNDENPTATDLKDRETSALQVHWMLNNICLLVRSGALPVVLEALKSTTDRDLAASLKTVEESNSPPRTFSEGDESVDLWCLLTLVYVIVEATRIAGNTSDGSMLRKEMAPYQMKLLSLTTQVIAQTRWDDAAPIPQTKIFLLNWKTMLLCFGGIEDVNNVKLSFQDDVEETDKRGQPVITTSPLDYHLFRQEISSKYPAYQPPQPLFPFEPDNNTILPPLRHRQAKLDGTDPFMPGVSIPSISSSSIMHQPVHIATPAPSPPPSPAGPGGKGGKKQNYQTNQMFPLLYPPLDSSSNDLGGRGSTELQDTLVGRKWQGSDVPMSILEAAELFAKRMRATRAMKQLWETRVNFMRYERGWEEDQEDVDVGNLSLDNEEKSKTADVPPLEKTQSDVEKRLAAVEQFYAETLPHMQSVVIVLLKTVLKNVTDLVMASNGRNGLQPGFQEQTNGVPNGTVFQNPNGSGPEPTEDTAEQIDLARSQEIAGKALSAILLLMLKWFKVSHILRYEYLTQLLLDSNYVPLILKLWQTQDIGRACHFNLDREESNFFAFCRAHSRNPDPSHHRTSSSSSSDSAAPPPITRRRTSSLSPTTSANPFAHPPEVDELGYATTPLPATPLTSFSHRNVFSYTNYLRILQKMTRRKTHRSLLLVSYKSSIHLKKSLRVPVECLRYYTLKLFKSQVPYCGRKWRQSNMKIITAVWLSVPADLRDDWLTGGGGGMGGAGPGDVDGTVDEALPLEQSLRSLTHWWNVRMYPLAMGVEGEAKAEMERDWFRLQLERMEGWLPPAGWGDEEGEGGGEEAWVGLGEGF